MGYEEEEINLLDYWRVIYKRRRLVIYATGAAMLLSVVVALVLPVYYAATAAILPPSEQPLFSFMPGQMGSTGLPDLGRLGSGLLGKGTAVDTWMDILRSQSVEDSLIKQFKLAEVYGTETIEGTRAALEGHVGVEASKGSVISITVEDRVPNRAAEMANALVMELDRVNRLTSNTSSSRMRAFLDKRLAESKIALAAAEEGLKAFQERNRAVKLDDQSRAVMEAIGSVKGQLMAKEVELQSMSSYATGDNPRLQIVRSEVSALRGKLAELERGSPAGSSVIIGTDRLPGLGLQYARLIRDLKTQEVLHDLITQRFELARIQEAQDTPTVQVLDWATMPENKSRPRRTLIVLISTFAALFGSVMAAFVLESLGLAAERARRGPGNQA